MNNIFFRGGVFFSPSHSQQTAVTPAPAAEAAATTAASSSSSSIKPNTDSQIRTRHSNIYVKPPNSLWLTCKKRRKGRSFSSLCMVKTSSLPASAKSTRHEITGPPLLGLSKHYVSDLVFSTPMPRPAQQRRGSRGDTTARKTRNKIFRPTKFVQRSKNNANKEPTISEDTHELLPALHKTPHPPGKHLDTVSASAFIAVTPLEGDTEGVVDARDAPGKEDGLAHLVRQRLRAVP